MREPHLFKKILEYDIWQSPVLFHHPLSFQLQVQIISTRPAYIQWKNFRVRFNFSKNDS